LDLHVKKVILVLLAMAALSAHATETEIKPTGWTLSGDIGSSSDSKDSGFGFGIGFGYRFTPYVGVEGTFRRLMPLGGAMAYDTKTGKPVSASANLNSKGASVLGLYPFAPSLTAFGRLGYSEVTVDVEAAGYQSIELASKSGAVYGAGLEYRTSQTFSVRAEFQRHAAGKGVNSFLFGGALHF
jgi:opacity protein-like surface antigen